MNKGFQVIKTIYVVLFIIFLMSCTACSKKKDQAVDNSVTTAPEQAAGDGMPEDNTGEAFPDTSPSPVTPPVSVTPSGAADSGDHGDNLPYKILEASYLSDDVIRIYYPQLTGLSDSAVMDKANGIIKNKVMKYTEGFDTKQESAALNINYTVTWKGENLASFLFIGYRNTPDAAYPVSFSNTVNINIKTGEEVNITDLLKTDTGFIELLRRNSNVKYYYFDENRNLLNDDSFSATDRSSVLKDYVFNNDFPIDFINSEGTDSLSAYSYFTKDSLGISFETIHAYGDHIELEIKYSEISNFINQDNPLWDDFPEATLQADTTDLPPTGGPEQNANSINEDEIIKNTNYVPGFYIIKDQSFWVELENWGKVYFLSAGGEGEFGLNSLYMYLADKDSNILYEFPYFYGNGMLFGSIHAVSFKDVNNDGLKDIIVIAGYMTGIGPTGAQEYPVASIYFQKGKEFVTIPSLDDDLNASEKNGTVGDIMDYLKETSIPLKVE